MKNNNLFKNLIVILFSVLCHFINNLAMAYTDKYNPSSQPENQNKYRLPDLILDYFYPIFQKTLITEKIGDIFGVLAFFFVTIRIIYYKESSILFRRVSLILNFTYLLRAPSIILTMLPQPLFTCISKKSDSLKLIHLLIYPFYNEPCGDVFFSGHTIILSSLVLVYYYYPTKFKFYNYFMIFFGYFGMFSLIFSALHYTIDVLFSLFINFVIWNYYHFIILTDYFDQTIYYQFIIYFENNNKKKINKNYEFEKKKY